MKFDLKYNQLPLFTLLCGGLGALLRLWLYGTGLDDEGLLVRGHAAGILVLILSALVIGSLIWFLYLIRRKKQSSSLTLRKSQRHR